MSNPKEKAKELVEWSITYGASKEVSKLFSVKLVDEILNAIHPFGQFLGKDFWQEVKQEILAL